MRFTPLDLAVVLLGAAAAMAYADTGSGWYVVGMGLALVWTLARSVG